ncbi:hypothetical protein E4U59_002918 [Claviceps monticola]|nr:hypothetical protein E4U59_002918 [Claviceps monticola]
MFDAAPVAFEQRFPSEVRTQSTNSKQKKPKVGALKAPKPEVNPDLIATWMIICGGHPLDLWEQHDMVNFTNALVPE